MRFVVEIYRAIRARVGAQIPVGIKINSADFQKGGFSEEDSRLVIRTLAEEGMDLIEISGGNYESPSMMGENRKASTREREAYFLDFAEKIRRESSVALAVTGGFRTHKGMAEAVASGAVDMVGLGRPLAVDPQLPNKILAGEAYTSPVGHVSTGFRKVDQFSMLQVTWYENQLARLAAGKRALPNMNPWRSIMTSLVKNGVQVFQKRRAS